MDRGKAVEQDLPHNNRSLPAIEPGVVTERFGDDGLIEFFRTDARFKPHLRQIRALGLPQLRFRCAAVGGSFADTWVGQDGVIYCVVDQESI